MLRRAVAQPPIARVCQVLRSFAQLADADCRVAFGLVLTVDRTGMGCYDRSVSMDLDGPFRPDLSVYAESCIVRDNRVCLCAGWDRGQRSSTISQTLEEDRPRFIGANARLQWREGGFLLPAVVFVS